MGRGQNQTDASFVKSFKNPSAFLIDCTRIVDQHFQMFTGRGNARSSKNTWRDQPTFKHIIMKLTLTGLNRMNSVSLLDRYKDILLNVRGSFALLSCRYCHKVTDLCWKEISLLSITNKNRSTSILIQRRIKGEKNSKRLHYFSRIFFHFCLFIKFNHKPINIH